MPGNPEAAEQMETSKRWGIAITPPDDPNYENEAWHLGGRGQFAECAWVQVRRSRR